MISTHMQGKHAIIVNDKPWKRKKDQGSTDLSQDEGPVSVLIDLCKLIIQLLPDTLRTQPRNQANAHGMHEAAMLLLQYLGMHVSRLAALAKACTYHWQRHAIASQLPATICPLRRTQIVCYTDAINCRQPSIMVSSCRTRSCQMPQVPLCGRPSSASPASTHRTAPAGRPPLLQCGRRAPVGWSRLHVPAA